MKRTVGHYLLLTLAIVFLIEEFVFLTTALSHAGRQPWIAKRFLILTLGVFLTAVVAFYGFVKRIELPGLTVIGLLMIQPAVGAIANVIGEMPQKNIPLVGACAVIGVALLAFVIRRNALGKRNESRQ